MAIIVDKTKIEQAGFDYIEGTEFVKDAPPGLNKVTQAVVDLMAKGSAGGFYLNELGQKVDYVMVASDTDPGKTKTIDGKTYEVWWIQTQQPDPSQWVPSVPSFDIAGYTYTIPSDMGATYTVHGVTAVPGTHSVTPPATVNIVAVPKSGYAFKAGATSSWSKMYEETPLAMDAAAASLAVPYYYRLDEAPGAGKPKNRGAASDTAGFWWPNAKFTDYVSAPLAGVGTRAFQPTGSTTIGLDDGVQLSALTVAAAVNAQGAAPNFALTLDWAQQKHASFIGLTGIHHVAATWDGTSKRLYVDGALTSEVAEGLPTSAALKLFTTPKGYTALPTVSFAGLVVDKSRALTAAQIKTLSDAVVR